MTLPNGETKTNTEEHIRAVVNDELSRRDYVTSAQVTALLEKQTDTFQAGLGSLRTELLGGIKTLRKDVFDELKEWRTIIKTQDLTVRNAEAQTEKYSQLASRIEGQNDAIGKTLDRFSGRLDTVTDDLEDRLDDAIKRIEAQIATYSANTKAQMDERITPLEVFVNDRKAIEGRIKSAAKFVLTSPKWLAVIGGGGTAGALLLELLKALGGG